MVFTSKDVLAAELPRVPTKWSEFRDQQRVIVDASAVHDVLRCLRDKAGFDQLIDLTAVDHLEMDGATDRFEVVYCLLKSNRVNA